MPSLALSTTARRANRTITLRLSITQHEKARQACPKCGSMKLTQLMSSFLTQTARKA